MAMEGNKIIIFWWISIGMEGNGLRFLNVCIGENNIRKRNV